MGIEIHGKQYMLVNERLQEFRKEFPNYGLVSEIVEISSDHVVMKATIYNETENIIAVGHAMEDRTSSMINQKSYVENCETSAWGRALANLGIGIDSAVASADEMHIAISQQSMMNHANNKGKRKEKEASEKQLNLIAKLMQDNNIEIEQMRSFVKNLFGQEVNSQELTSSQASTLIKALKDE